MQYLRADTNTEVLIGPVVAVGDGFTPVTTLAASTADEAELIKYGGATPLTVTSISASAMTAITSADGYYTLDLSTGNTDTEGFLTVLFNDDSLCLPVRHDFQVVNANVYDSMFAAATTDYLDVSLTQVNGAAQTATLDTIKAETVLIVADTGELQADWANAGRLDAILDIIAADTTTDIPALIAIAQADLDTITGAAGVVLDADAITAAKIADNAIATEHLAASAISKIWAEIIETNASITGQEALSLILAAVAGVTTAGGATLKDPSGTTTRITATINASNERTAMTVVPSA